MRRFHLIGVFLSLTLFTLAASAASPDLAVYFTANWPAADPALVTQLEQALLDRLTAAALYDFSRPSLRDALHAADAHGVRVRVVTDDEAHTGATSGPFYAAPQAAGIPLQ